MSSNNQDSTVRSADTIDAQAEQALSTPNSVVSEDDWAALSSDEVRDRSSKAEFSDRDDSERQLFEDPVYPSQSQGVAPSRGDDFETRIRDDNENLRRRRRMKAGRARDRKLLEEKRKQVEKEEEKYGPMLLEHSNSPCIPPALQEKVEQFPLRRTTRTTYRGSISSREHESTACSGFGRASGERLGVPNGPAWRRPPGLGDRGGMVRSVEDCNVRATRFGRASSEHVREAIVKEMAEERWEREEAEGMLKGRESALQRAHRVAQEATESGQTPLNLRREGFGMLVPFKGVAESREVPVYERLGGERGTDKEEYERWKVKVEEEAEKGEMKVEPRVVSRYASSFGKRRATLRDSEDTGLAGEAGVLLLSGERETIRPLGTKTTESTANKHTPTPTSPRKQLKDRSRTLEVGFPPPEIYWEQLKAVWKESGQPITHRTEGAVGGGISTTKFLAVMTTCIQPQISPSKAQEDLFATVKSELGLPKGITRDQFRKIPISGMTESREPPSLQRSDVERSADTDDHGGWLLYMEDPFWVTLHPRYTSSSGQRIAAKTEGARAGPSAEGDGAAMVNVGTGRDLSKDVENHGLIKESMLERRLGKMPARAPVPEASKDRSFDEVWEELCAENGWDENDEVKKKMYRQLVGKMSERYREASTPQSERVSATAGTTQSREGDEEWIGQNIRQKFAPRVCSYGSTKSREVIDERVAGFGMSRQSELGRPELDTSERRSARDGDTSPGHISEAPLRQVPAERQQFHTSRNEPISSRTLAVYEDRRRFEDKPRESRIEVNKGGATSREDAFRRKYEGEHARLARLQKEERHAKMEQEAKQEREQRLREINKELERPQIMVDSRRRGSTESREDELRREFEVEHARPSRSETEKRLGRMEQEAKQEREPKMREMLEEEKRLFMKEYKMKGSTDSREDEERRKYEAEKAYVERLDREQRFDTREPEALEMFQGGILRSGTTQGRDWRSTHALVERGSASSREAPPRRKYEEEKARQQRLQKLEFMAQANQSMQAPQYSIGKEHLGDSNDGLRSRSTIGTTSAEKMPMRGGNYAASLHDNDTVDEDEDDVEVNLEGLVLRSRVQVPEAMSRAMKADEEWRGFA